MKWDPKRLLAVFLVLMLLSAESCATAEVTVTLALPSTLKVIDDEAFYCDASIGKVIIPNGTKQINSRAFANSSLTELLLPDTLTYIAENAFEGCGNFTVRVPWDCYAYDWCFSHNLLIAPPALEVGSNRVVIQAGQTVQMPFTAPAAGTYRFYTTGTLDTYGHLYDENQTQLDSDDDDGDDTNFLISYNLTRNQLVYVGVRFYSSDTSGTVPLTVEYTPAPDLEIGTTNVTIEAGQTVQMPFTAPAAGTYRFYTTGSLDTYGHLYDENLTQLDSDDDSGDDTNFQITCDLTRNQQVYVGVRFYSSGTSGTVPLTVEYTPVSDLEIGTTNVTIEAGQTTQLSFIAPAAGTYSFYTTGSQDTYGHLYDENLTQLDSDDDSGDNTNFLISCNLTRNQMVYVGVRFYSSGSACTVPLTVEYTPPSNLEVGTTNVTIKAGQTTQLSFIAPADGTYSFYTTGSQDTYGYLYDENQALLDSDDDDGDNTNFLITCDLTKNQQVYVGVRFYNSGSAGTVPLTVEYTPVSTPSESVVYRYYLVGNTYPGTYSELEGPDNDVAAMARMLELYPGSDYTGTCAINVNASAIKRGIANAFVAADSNDVSLFFYSGHGTSAGEFCGTDDTYITVSELRSCLDQIPGTKIVLLDCCYSGAYIDKSDSAPSPSDFNDAVISAFRSYTEARGNLATSNYQVMTACSKNETSKSLGTQFSDGSIFWYGAFTHGVCMGSGYHMINDELCTAYADANKDGIINLGEAYDDTLDTIEDVLCVAQSTQYHGSRSFILWYK